MVKILISLLLIYPTLSFSQPLKVRVIGVSDAQADGTQKDRHEAIIDAKRNAIEKAGISIQSKTTVENFVVSSDKIETLADAVLLPGFEIIDVGYDSDNVVYKIVLVGEIQSGQPSKKYPEILYRTKQGCRLNYRVFQDNQILEEKLACDIEHPIDIKNYDNLVILSPAETGLTSRWIEVALPKKKDLKNNKLIVKGTEIQRIKADYTKEGETKLIEGSEVTKTFQHSDSLNYFDGKTVKVIKPSTQIVMKGSMDGDEFKCKSTTRTFFLDGKQIKKDELEAPCHWPLRGEFEYKGKLDDGSDLILKARHNGDDWYWVYDLDNKIVDELYNTTEFYGD